MTLPASLLQAGGDPSIASRTKLHLSQRDVPTRRWLVLAAERDPDVRLEEYPSDIERKNVIRLAIQPTLPSVSLNKNNYNACALSLSYP